MYLCNIFECLSHIVEVTGFNFLYNNVIVFLTYGEVLRILV